MGYQAPEGAMSMQAVDWLVAGGGAAAIAWVLWYFFVADSSVDTNDRAPATEPDVR